MVGFAPLLGVAALYAGVVRAAPAPDSSYGSSNSGSSGSSYGSSGNSYGSSGNSGSSYGSSGNSYGSSDNSYGSSGNSYGSSDNSYGSSGNSYGSQNSYGGNSYNANSGNSYSSSSSPSSSVWSTSTTTSSTSTAMATSTSSYSTPSYGSGSMSWNAGSGYNDCVQQCVASYGGPSATASWPSETSSYGSSGSGATHTVIVAPTQGVLRYIPFATNASVGDTVKFVWGAGPHTVTKSSELTPCNKTSDAPFASGMQNKSFVFTQVVNDTNPSFYYCGVPGHCEKGMFGIINPPSQYNNAGSASNMIPEVAKNYSSTSAAWSYTQNATMSNSAAQSWGNNIDMSQLPSWSWPYASENVLYTRAFLAQNSETLKSDGSVDLGAIGSNPLMIPNDVAAAAGSNNAAAATSSSSSSSTASSYGSASASPSSSPVAASSKSGAGAISVSRGAVALAAVAAAFFAL